MRSVPSSPRSVRFLLAGALIAAGTACAPTATAPITPSDVLDGVETCAGGSAINPVDAEVRVRLLIGSGIHEDEAMTVLGDIAAFYEPYGFTFGLDRFAWVEAPSVLGDSLASIESRVLAAGTPLGTPEADALVASIALEPIRAFLERNSVPPRSRIDVVVLADVADDASAIQRIIGDIAGLGITPGALPEGLLPAGFTPTVFLSSNTLAVLPPYQQAIVAAHELAHAFGLVHDQQSGSLMNPELTDCIPTLTDAQVGQILSSSAVRTGQ